MLGIFDIQPTIKTVFIFLFSVTHPQLTSPCTGVCICMRLCVWPSACASVVQILRGGSAEFRWDVCVMDMIQRALWEAGMQSRHGLLKRQFGLHVPPGLHKTHLLFTRISYCYRSIFPSGQGRFYFITIFPCTIILNMMLSQNLVNNHKECDKEFMSRKLLSGN